MDLKKVETTSSAATATKGGDGNSAQAVGGQSDVCARNEVENALRGINRAVGLQGNAAPTAESSHREVVCSVGRNADALIRGERDVPRDAVDIQAISRNRTGAEADIRDLDVPG